MNANNLTSKFIVIGMFNSISKNILSWWMHRQSNGKLVKYTRMFLRHLGSSQLSLT
uniref:Uncharacterized protein n=3 Tax=Cercopithecinae TaxID=9528 RepID=A0A2K5KV77_CERAT|nr:unnamed protein product [Macaca fascicularis]